MQRLSLSIIIFAGLVQAQPSSVSVLNLPKAGSGEFFLLILLCCALAGTAVLFETAKVRRDRFVEKRVIQDRFKQNARRFGLDAEEREALRDLERFADGGDINELFESLAVFEPCVDALVNEALAAGGGEQSLQELEDVLTSLRKKLRFIVLEQGQPILSTRNLSAGQNIWMLGPRKTIIGEAVVLLVRELYFSVKMTGKDFGRLAAFESPVCMAFTRKADGIYGIEAPLVSFDPSSGTVKCRHTIKFKRNQLRQDVRVETDFMVSIRLVASDAVNAGKSFDAASFMVKMTDLSGGGFAFVSERQLAVGDTVMVNAASSRLTIGGLRAKVVGFSQSRFSQKYLYHAQFVNLEYEKKEQIVKYVFVRMRELNQR